MLGVDEFHLESIYIYIYMIGRCTWMFRTSPEELNETGMFKGCSWNKTHGFKQISKKHVMQTNPIPLNNTEHVTLQSLKKKWRAMA